MAVISFADSVGQTVAFDAGQDILSFSGAYDAGALLFEAAGNDLLVRNGTQLVRLATVTFGSLTGANFQFADGGLALFDAPGTRP